jgi:hypothetical protein
VYYIKFKIKPDSLLPLEWYVLDLDYVLVFTKCVGGGGGRRWLFIFTDDKKEETASSKIGSGGKVQREIRLTLVSHVF